MALRSAKFFAIIALLSCSLFVATAGAEVAARPDTSAGSALAVRLDERVVALEVEVAELTDSLDDRKILLNLLADRFQTSVAVERKLLLRLDELDGRSTDAEQAKRSRIVALYRAGRLGSPRVLRDKASETKARRLSRYIASLAESDEGRDEGAEIEHGAVLVALDQARVQAAGTQRQARDIELEIRTDEHALIQLQSRLDGARTDRSLLEQNPGTAPTLVASAEPTLPALPPLGEDEPFEFPAMASDSEDDGADESGAGLDAGAVTTATEPEAGDVARLTAEAEAAAEHAEVLVREADDAQRTAQDEEAEAARRAARLVELAREVKLEQEVEQERETKARASQVKKKGFVALKGFLTPPVRGRVIARFGQKHTSGTVYRGLIVRGPAAVEVKATAAGDVVFSGPFPGLGATVIVAHGDRYHSVYARMDAARVAVGSHVDVGRAVGFMPSDNGDLHFEMRLAGKAFDPLVWFTGGADAFAP